MKPKTALNKEYLNLEISSLKYIEKNK